MIPRHRFPRLHFVGIGGSGMAPLAMRYADLGFFVTGSDRSESEATRAMRLRGLEIVIGHEPENVRGADLVVRTSAVRAGNPEVDEALRLGIPVVRRAEALGELTRSSHTLAICGTHGKTTTTLMLGRLLSCAGVSPVVLPGGVPVASEDASLPTPDSPLVVEADEFDRSFLALHPAAAIVTNIDADHLDCYADIDDIYRAFVSFLDRLPFHGYALVCGDDERARALKSDVRAQVLTYGMGEGADYRGIEEDDGGVAVEHKGRLLARFRLGVPGRHNRLNALAALSLAHREGVDPELGALALGRFAGARRRLEILSDADGLAVVDDYAHHPAEVTASLQAMRERWPGRKLVVLFQPHLYSRTRDLAVDFAAALRSADRVVVAPVYAARETPDQGAESDAILAAAGSRSFDLASGRADAIARVRDAVAGCEAVAAFMGAGDVGSWARELVPGGARE